MNYSQLLKFAAPETIVVLTALAVLAGVGIVIGVAYTLRAMQKAFFGESVGASAPLGAKEAKPAGSEPGAPFAPISVPERLGAVMLIGVAVLIGLYPRLLLDVILPSFDSPLFDWLRKGGAP